MTRTLGWKLTLAFLLVGLTGAILVAVFVRAYTQQEFGRFVLDQNQQVLVNNLTRYYQIHGSWAGVESVFRSGASGAPPIADNNPRRDAWRNLFAIADEDGTIVFGGRPEDQGRRLRPSDLNKGVPLQVGDQTVGWLVFLPLLDRWRPGTPEGNFLLGVNRATLTSALVATLVALLIGGVLAYTLTRRLRELTAATQAVARGDLGHQVPVRSQDELGQLGRSFNQMSAELARSNQLRQQMTADIAHDLRTPLSVILGYSEALKDGKLTPTGEMFDVIHNEAQQLSRLVDDLKVLSLADAGELPLSRQQVSPLVLLKRAAAAHQIEAEKAQIALRVTSQETKLPAIDVDVERMAQVLGNLVSNALRYTPPGGEIILSAGAQDGMVALMVQDTGAGIAPEDLLHIFERSFRGDKARKQQHGETGLGLAIAKSIVEAHGGKIEVHSHLGEGTTFRLFMPAAHGKPA